MNIQQYFQSLGERLHSSASVKTVYGDPVTAEGKTVIPVAKIAYGYGAGTGTCRHGGENGDGEGGGGGVGVAVSPVGVVEITQEKTQFIPVFESRKLAGSLGLGLMIGFLIGRRRGKG